MNRPARNGSASAGRVAVLHESGGEWALLIAERRANLTVLEARGFGRGQEAEVLAALAAAGVSRLIRIAPGSRTVARVAEIPAGPAHEMGAAAALLAEGTLPDDVPEYRRGAGLIPDGGRGARTASGTVLLTAWRNGTSHDQAVSWPAERWTTEIAGLAFLCGGRGAGVYAAPGGGSLSLIANGASRTVARVLVEAPGDATGWRAVRARALDETCGAAGIPALDAGAPGSGQRLVLSPDALEAAKGAVTGAKLDAAWLDRFGIALGAAMAATSPDQSSRRLAEMIADAPTTRAPGPERLAAWLARPRHAVAVATVSVLAMLLVPLALAGARLGVLNAKAGTLPDQDKARSEIERRAALYRELDQSRWPMTKLWSDISAAVPEGVIAEALSLSADQGLSIKGTAETPELLSTFQKNLNSTGLFGNVKFPRTESTTSGVSFDLSASVVGPHTAVRPVDDFAAKPLVVRLYGEGASAGSGHDAEAPAPSGTEGGRGERRGNRGGRSEEAGGPRPSKPVDIPPPLTDEQIAAMDWKTSMMEWTKRKSAAAKPGLDAATKARLDAEVPKVKERMDQAKPKGGGS